MSKTKHVLTKLRKLISECIEDFHIHDCEQKFLKQLNEGLIETYSLEQSINEISRFLLTNNEIRFNINYEEKTQRIFLTLYSFFTDKNIDGIMSKVNSLGYFPSQYRIQVNNSNMSITKNYNILDLKRDLELIGNNYRYVYFIIESKYDKKPEMELKRAYHVTRFLVLNKILEKGLSPRANKSSHPERVYFTDSAAQAALYAAQLRRTHQISRDDYYVILEIKGDCLKEIDIHLDPNFEGGYYTYSNIKPECLTHFNPAVKL